MADVGSRRGSPTTGGRRRSARACGSGTSGSSSPCSHSTGASIGATALANLRPVLEQAQERAEQELLGVVAGTVVVTPGLQRGRVAHDGVVEISRIDTRSPQLADHNVAG